MSRMHNRIVLTTIAIAILLGMCLRLGGIWSIVLDAALLVGAIISACIAKEGRSYVFLAVFGIVLLLVTSGLVLDIRTEFSARREMNFVLCADSKIVKVEGQKLDDEEYRGYIVKDFLRYGVARNVRLSFESGCTASNLFSLFEIDAELLMRREYLLVATPEPFVFSCLLPFGLNMPKDKSASMLVIEPDGKLRQFAYRLDAAMINKWYEWATKNGVFKSYPNHHSSSVEHTREMMCPNDNPNPKQAVKHGVLFLLIDQTMPLRNLQDSLPEAKRLFPNEMVFIVPLVPGCMDWMEKEIAKQGLSKEDESRRERKLSAEFETAP